MSVRSGGGGGARGGGGRNRGGGGEGRVRGTSWKDAHADVSSASNIADLRALLDVPPIAGEKDETYLVGRALVACGRLGALEKESKGGGKHAQLWGMLVDIVKPHMSEFFNDQIFLFLQGISSHLAASGVNLLDDDMDLRAAFEKRVTQIHMKLTFATVSVMTEIYKCSAKPPHNRELYPCLEERLCNFHSAVTPLNALKVQGHFDKAIANFKACSERHGYIIPEVSKAKLVVPAPSTDFQAQLQRQERQAAQAQQLRSGGAIKNALGYQHQHQQHQQQAVHTPPQPPKQVADEDVIFNCSSPNALADVYYDYGHAQTLTLKRLILFYKKIKKEAPKYASIMQHLGPLWGAITHEVMRFMCEAQGADLAIILESHVECKTDPTVELQQVIDQRAVQLLESGAVQQVEVTRIVVGYARLVTATPSSRLVALLLGETGKLSMRMGAAEVGMSIYGWGMLSHSSALVSLQPNLAMVVRGLMDRVGIILSNEVDPEHLKMSAFDLSWAMWGFFNLQINPPYDLLELVQARAILTLGPHHPEELARFVRAWAWTGKPPSEEAVEAWQTCIVGLTMDDQNETGGGLGPAAMSMLMYSFSTMNVMKDFSTLAIKSMEDHSINIINGYDFKNVALTLWSYAWSGMLPCAELLQKLIQQGIACCDDDANNGSPHQAKGNEIANTLWSLAVFKDMSPMHDDKLFREFIRCLSKMAVDMYFTFTLQNIVDSLNAFVSMRFQSSSLQNNALVRKFVEKIHTEIHRLRLDQLADILLALNELLPGTAVDEHFLHCMDEWACVLLEQNSYVQYPEVLARLVISYTGHEEEKMKRMPPGRLIELLVEEFHTSSCNEPLLLQQWWIFAMHLVFICGVRTETVTPTGIHVGSMVKKLLITLKEDPRAAPPANVSQHAEEMAKVLIEMGYAARIGKRDLEVGGRGTKYALDIMFVYQNKNHVLLVQSDDDVVSSDVGTSMRRAARAKCSLLKARHYKVVPVAIHQWMNLPDRLTAQGLLQQVVQAVVAQPDNS